MGEKHGKPNIKKWRRYKLSHTLINNSVLCKVYCMFMLTNKWHTDTEQTEETRQTKHLTHKLY
jgi:hypothetical protein